MFDLIFDERPIRSVAIQTNERFQYTLTGALQELLRVAHVYNPRETISGPARGYPVSLSTVRTTIRIPSCAGTWRSRNTICPTSPTPSRSTNTFPQGT